MNEPCLYLYDGGCLTRRDITRALGTLGIQENDTMFVHSDIRTFGKLGPAQNRGTLCYSLVQALLDAIPEGTLAMPAFTYTFARTHVFDAENSPSEIGVLAEFFRAQKGVIRSRHPMFSVAAYGAKKIALLDTDLDAFGDNSFFGRLLAERGMIVFLGVSFQECTFIHHVEQCHKVPYRSMTTFRGVLRAARKETPIESTYYARPLDKLDTVVTDLSRLEKRLIERRVLKEARVGASAILAVRASDVLRYGLEMLNEDITAFLKQPLDPALREALKIQPIY